MLSQAFNVVQAVPALTSAAQVAAVLNSIQLPATPAVITNIAASCYLPIPVKQLLMVAEMSKQEQVTVTPQRFDECLQACGFDAGTGISLHSDVAAKNNLSFYTSASSSSSSSSKPRSRRDEDEEDD